MLTETSYKILTAIPKRNLISTIISNSLETTYYFSNTYSLFLKNLSKIFCLQMHIMDPLIQVTLEQCHLSLNWHLYLSDVHSLFNHFWSQTRISYIREKQGMTLGCCAPHFLEVPHMSTLHLLVPFHRCQWAALQHLTCDCWPKTFHNKVCSSPGLGSRTTATTKNDEKNYFLIPVPRSAVYIVIKCKLSITGIKEIL